MAVVEFLDKIKEYLIIHEDEVIEKGMARHDRLISNSLEMRKEGDLKGLLPEEVDCIEFLTRKLDWIVNREHQPIPPNEAKNIHDKIDEYLELRKALGVGEDYNSYLARCRSATFLAEGNYAQSVRFADIAINAIETDKTASGASVPDLAKKIAVIGFLSTKALALAFDGQIEAALHCADQADDIATSLFEGKPESVASVYRYLIAGESNSDPKLSTLFLHCDICAFGADTKDAELRKEYDRKFKYYWDYMGRLGAPDSLKIPYLIIATSDPRWRKYARAVHRCHRALYVKASDTKREAIVSYIRFTSAKLDRAAIILLGVLASAQFLSGVSVVNAETVPNFDFKGGQYVKFVSEEIPDSFEVYGATLQKKDAMNMFSSLDSTYYSEEPSGVSQLLVEAEFVQMIWDQLSEAKPYSIAEMEALQKDMTNSYGQADKVGLTEMDVNTLQYFELFERAYKKSASKVERNEEFEMIDVNHFRQNVDRNEFDWNDLFDRKHIEFQFANYPISDNGVIVR